MNVQVISTHQSPRIVQIPKEVTEYYDGMDHALTAEESARGDMKLFFADVPLHLELFFLEWAQENHMLIRFHKQINE